MQNIGLQARILSTRTFTIFVVMALVTTFATTPLTSALYPPWYQKKIEAWKRGEIDWDSGNPLTGTDGSSSARDSFTYEKLESTKMQRLLVYLRLDNMPMLLAFMSLLGGTPQSVVPKVHPSNQFTEDGEQSTNPHAVADRPRRPIQTHGVRLLELTERSSSVMKVSEVDEYSVHDPVVNTFRTFGQLHNLAVSGEVAVVPESLFADVLVSKASDHASDLVLLPWSETGSMSESHIISSDSVRNKLATATYNQFIASALQNATCNTAVFVNKNFGGSGMKQGLRLTRTLSSLSMRSHRDNATTAPIADRSHHMFLAFFGGADDKVALRLVLQLAENPDVTATIVQVEVPEAYFEANEPPTSPMARTNTSSSGMLNAATAGPVAPTASDAVFFASLRNSLPVELACRVSFETLQSATPLRDVLERAKAEVGQSPRNAGDLVVVGRNGTKGHAFARESKGAGGEASGCLGVVAEAVVRSGVGASVLVVQARGKGMD